MTSSAQSVLFSWNTFWADLFVCCCVCEIGDHAEPRRSTKRTLVAHTHSLTPYQPLLCGCLSSLPPIKPQHLGSLHWKHMQIFVILFCFSPPSPTLWEHYFVHLFFFVRLLSLFFPGDSNLIRQRLLLSLSLNWCSVPTVCLCVLQLMTKKEVLGSDWVGVCAHQSIIIGIVFICFYFALLFCSFSCLLLLLFARCLSKSN